MSKENPSQVEQIHPKTQQNISKAGLVNYMLNPSLGDKGVPISLSTIVFGIVMFVAILYFFVYEPMKRILFGIGLEPIYVIIAVAVIAILFILYLVWPKGKREEKKRAISLEKKLEKLEQRYGDKDKILQEIEQQITKGIAYITLSNQIITKDWFVSPVTGHIVRLTDIAAIIGSMDEGTHIMTDEGDIIDTMFGQDTWGATFALFEAANPHLLSNRDAVTMPNGKDAAVYTVFSSKNAGAIIEEFLRRKQKGGN